MRDWIKKYFNVKKNITSDSLREIFELLQMFFMALAVPISSILKKRGYFDSTIFIYLGEGSGGRTMIFLISCMAWLITYPIFIWLDKMKKYRSKR